MSLFLTRTIEQDHIAAARHQNAVLFSKPGLAVYAVPWEYALCGKTDRLTKPDRRPYDISDAVAYLSQCIKGNRGHAIQAREVEAWARKYNKAVSRSVLIEIDAAYRSSHGEHGIIF